MFYVYCLFESCGEILPGSYDCSPPTIFIKQMKNDCGLLFFNTVIFKELVADGAEPRTPLRRA